RQSGGRPPPIETCRKAPTNKGHSSVLASGNFWRITTLSASTLSCGWTLMAMHESNPTPQRLKSKNLKRYQYLLHLSLHICDNVSNGAGRRVVLQRHNTLVGDDKTTRQNPCDTKQRDGLFLKQFYIRNMKVRILQSTNIRPVRLI